MSILKYDCIGRTLNKSNIIVKECPELRRRLSFVNDWPKETLALFVKIKSYKHKILVNYFEKK